MPRIVVALRYLTIVPSPGTPSREGPGTAAAWFPAVGAVIGGSLALVDRGAAALFTPVLAAVITLTVWKVISGGLHLDGVADCLDGLIGRDAAHRLAIMRDSRIGAFGTIGIALVLLLDAGALAGIDARARWRALIVAPVVGRAMPPLMARLFPATPCGQGARFRAELARSAPAAVVVIAAVVAGAMLGVLGLAALVLAIIVAASVSAFMTRRLGGVTGDVHGACVELTELAVLLLVAAVAPAR